MHPRTAAFLALCTPLAVASAQVRYDPIGWLNGGNRTMVQALVPGWAVGLAYTAAGRTRAFSWTRAGGLAELPPLTPGGDSYAYTLSADGRVAAGWASVAGGARHACLWVGAAAPLDLGVLPGGASSAVRLVSADGSVAYGLSTNPAGVITLFRWTQAQGIQDAGAPSALLSASLSDISPDGAVIAAYNNAAQAGYLWSPASGLRTFAAPQLTINRVRADGWIAGYLWGSDNSIHAVTMPPSAGPALMDFPGGTACSATDVELGGAAAVGCIDAFNALGEARAYLRTPGGFTDLVPLVEAAGYRLDGWSLEGRVLSADGGRWIAGLSRRSGAGIRGFIISPACPADVTDDGIIDGFDYAAFLADFESGAPAADFNRDGFADFFDYADFLAAFESGC